MKKLFSLLVALTLCAPAFAATMLTDADMAGIYAKAVDINDVTARESTVVAQSNIGIIGAGSECNGKNECSAMIMGAMVMNGNLGLAVNLWGDAAGVLQSNIGVISALGGPVVMATVCNHNLGLALNIYPVDEEGGPVYEDIPTTIEAASLDAGEAGSINDTFARNSAVVSQSNIGVIYGEAGVYGATVGNCNAGAALNMPGPVAMGIIQMIDP